MGTPPSIRSARLEKWAVSRRSHGAQRAQQEHERSPGRSRAKGPRGPGENEEVPSGSVRLDGSGSPLLEDASLMEFHYVYTVMVPGCSSWGRPLT
jgi:hypothetical protein